MNLIPVNSSEPFIFLKDVQLYEKKVSEMKAAVINLKKLLIEDRKIETYEQLDRHIIEIFRKDSVKPLNLSEETTKFGTPAKNTHI